MTESNASNAFNVLSNANSVRTYFRKEKAMTNAQIIFNAGQELAKEGKIGYTGREFEMETPDGNKITVKETEDIHTYNTWKEMGFQVAKGQKAVAKITIWKHSKPKVDTLPMQDGKDVEYIDHGRMFLKTAAFFSRSQVEVIEDAS